MPVPQNTLQLRTRIHRGSPISHARRLSHRAALVVCLTLAVVTLGRSAGASPGSLFDFRRLVLDAVVATQGGSTRDSDRPRPESTEPVQLTAKWVGPSPRFTLVARDWGGAHLLAGDSLSVTDAFRRSRSYRMLVNRFQFEGGPLVPFVHIGAGQWRVDPEILLSMPRDTELAVQAAAGLEGRLARRAAFAIEADYTLLCRESREPQNLPTPRVIGLFAAMRAEF